MKPIGLESLPLLLEALKNLTFVIIGGFRDGFSQTKKKLKKCHKSQVDPRQSGPKTDGAIAPEILVET